MLDEIRIYNRALNIQEIDSICNFSPVSTLDCPTIGNLPDTIGICNNTSVPLNPTLNIPSSATAIDTFWSPTAGLSDPNILNPIATVSTPTNYVITVKAVGQTNLVVNGDFSSGNTGFSSSYVPGTGGSYGLCTNPATYGVDVSPSSLHSLWASFGDHTTGSGKMLVVNGSQSVGANIWCETIAVQPNTDYDFSAWLSSVEPTYPAILQFEINGLPIGSLLNAPLPTGVWGNFSAAWNSGNNTTATICITNQNTSFDGNDFALDDISFRGVCVVKDSVYIKTGAVTAAFTTPDTACTGSPIQFVSTQSGVPSMTYYWNFGDGSTANSSTSSHIYTNSGLYTVTLAISDTGGCTDTLSKQIFIREPYDNYTSLTLCEGESITFGNQTINDSGTFVQVFQSIGGCDSTVHLTVILNPQPSVDFTSTTALNMPVTFTNTSVNATSFLWEFGDGSTSNDFSPVHQYTSAGTYTACLTGWNDEGCSEKVCKEILTEIFTAIDVPLAFSPNGDGNNDVLYVRGGGVTEMTFRIYNRWGQMIFESHSLNEGWDGRFKGKLQDLETVAYVLQATFIDGTTIQKQGNVTIIK
jgi:gliding motility-associated-like protein